MIKTYQILFIIGACAALCAGILFITRDEVGGHLYKNCHWVNMRRSIVIDDVPYQLKFRTQKCSDKFMKATYAVKGTELIETRVHQTDQGPKKIGTRVATFWPYQPHTFKAKIAEINAPTLKEDEKGQCTVVRDASNNSYGYQPKRDYMTRMLAKNEPFAACGVFGFNNDKTAFFRVIDNHALVFFEIGQEAPLYVPHSFHLKKR
jgi:hypothetical protein